METTLVQLIVVY